MDDNEMIVSIAVLVAIVACVYNVTQCSAKTSLQDRKEVAKGVHFELYHER